MRRKGLTLLTLALVVLATVVPAAPQGRSGDQDLFNQGKIRMFDKNWEEARAVFQRVIETYPGSSLVPQASYFIARCLQFQGKEAEALLAYERFLQRYPQEPFLPAEARNAVVELAASLMEKGDNSYRNRLVAGFSDPRKEVRYFTAIRSSYLSDRDITRQAVPVLKEILARETERDLVNRAKIALLRLDPMALSQPAEAPPAKKSDRRDEPRMFRLQVFEGGSSQPKVELNIPWSLAQLAILALDESVKREMRKKGIDVENIWESLRNLGPTNILTIRDGQDIVKIWIE